MLRIRNTLRENILIRILVCVIIGILISEYFINTLSSIYIISLLAISLLLLLFFIIYYLNKRNVTFHTINGLLVYSISTIIFIIIHFNNQEINQISYHQAIQDSVITIDIKDDRQIRNSISSYPAVIINNNKSVGKIILNTDSNVKSLNFSDRLQLKNKIKNIRKQDWPGSFNYQQYLNNNHVYHQFRISNNDIISIEPQEASFILKFSHDSRNKLIDLLRKNIKEESVFELSAALLLGYRADLDKEVMNTFSRTGTIHIISVSGLHVGIIFFVLQWLVRKTRIIKNKIIESIILIGSIWMYSILTGLPPSVCRCSTMISFGIIARMIDQRTSAFNMLAGSALILLSIDTNMVFDIGFQLSYLAVSGILYVQKWLENLIYIKNKYLQQLWVLTSVSIAAQLFTLPLCLYYFHQFPNYFIPANMIAIPLSSIALYTSILTIFASGFTWLIELCDFTLKWSIVIMNESLNMIAELPYSVSENIYINTTETILFSIYILLFILLIVHKYRLVLKYVLLLMIIHLLYIENKESSNIRRNYISHNSIMPIYTYRFNNELRHVVPSSIEVKRLNKFLKSWANIDYFKHRVYLYDKNESVIIKNGIHKILIADRKRIASVNINKVDYLISNSWYVSNKIEARKIISNKDIDSNIAINVSKTGYLEF
jgi:competence protein ComEC